MKISEGTQVYSEIKTHSNKSVLPEDWTNISLGQDRTPEVGPKYMRISHVVKMVFQIDEAVGVNVINGAITVGCPFLKLC
jgi:hypothetical protein